MNTTPTSHTPPATPDWQPTLRGTLIHVRPLRAEDLDALHAAAADPLVWAQHSERDRHERPVFERFFAGAMASGGALAVLDAANGRIVGSSRYYDWNPADRSVVIGYTFLERAAWGGTINRELKRLMVDHAFRFARTVYFHVSPGNVRSQRALERIGAAFHHAQDVPVGGVMSPRLIYRLERP
ncbi:MAG: GNAT family protein [Phycisphaerae bacterium]